MSYEVTVTHTSNRHSYTWVYQECPLIIVIGRRVFDIGTIYRRLKAWAEAGGWFQQIGDPT